jgi:hypothetical protein
VHKGYTLSYFIKFFQSIPANQWCIGQTQEEGGSIKHCALGHAMRNNRTTLDKTTSFSNRSNVLNGFLANETADINDNQDGRYSILGKTPKVRILRALRNRKRYGNIFGQE